MLFAAPAAAQSPPAAPGDGPSWAGPPVGGSNPQQAETPPPGSPGDVAAPTPIEAGQLIARIGTEVVLASEVLGPVNQRVELTKDKILQSGLDLERVRRYWMRQQLEQLIDTKLLLADARRTIPKENFPNIWAKVDEQFEKTELPRYYELTKTSDPIALDLEIRKQGTTLEQQKQVFRERALAGQWLRQDVDFKPEISHEEILARYRKTIADYEYQAAVRWEELAVNFARFASQREAYEALAQLGNRVLGGESLAELAKSSSHGLTADKGGVYDWTTRGSLLSKDLEQALFTLPIGELSQIIETRTGFHIVRVVERREDGCTPFTEAQSKIREELRKENINQQMQDRLAELRSKTRIWTLFDNDPPFPGDEKEEEKQ